MNTLKYTAEKMIMAIQKHSGNMSAAASMLGCNRQTVMNYAARYPTVQQAIMDEREKVVDMAESALYAAILNKEAWAVSLTLKTIGRNRGYVERTENVLQGDPLNPVVNKQEHSIDAATVAAVMVEFAKLGLATADPAGGTDHPDGASHPEE